MQLTGSTIFTDRLRHHENLHLQAARKHSKAPPEKLWFSKGKLYQNPLKFRAKKILLKARPVFTTIMATIM
jgi:hypothetical protein